MPLRMRSFPVGLMPCLELVPDGVGGHDRNGVPSPRLPDAAQAFPSRVSMSCPMVMRDGMALGLTMMAGTVPSRVNGRSSGATTCPTVPFCAWREANLSPTMGQRSMRIRTLTRIFLLGGRPHHVVDPPGVVVLHDDALVKRHGRPGPALVAPDRHGFADDDVAGGHDGADGRGAVGLELAVVRVALAPVHVGAGDLVPLAADGGAALVRPVVRHPPEPAVDGGPAEEHAVFLVEPPVRHDRHDGHHALGVLRLGPQPVDLRGDDRALRVVGDEQVAVVPVGPVLHHEAERLLAHGRLVDVSGRLVVVQERLREQDTRPRMDMGLISMCV